MIEIELKFLISEIKNLSLDIIEAGFILTKDRTYEKNVMYDNASNLMQSTDGRIRLRASGSINELAYKKPITREGIKQEIEYEVTVSDALTMHDILTQMEFYPTTSYERYRTEYKKDGIKITIDEYPFANFVEIEGAKVDIIPVAEGLGFKLEDNLTDSCDTLFTKWRATRNLNITPHMRFNDYDR